MVIRGNDHDAYYLAVPIAMFMRSRQVSGEAGRRANKLLSSDPPGMNWYTKQGSSTSVQDSVGNYVLRTNRPSPKYLLSMQYPNSGTMLSWRQEFRNRSSLKLCCSCIRSASLDFTLL